ncbi:hypothetical protein DEJ48_10345 [Streptomyces venezuelae]|uniref:Uncharacterized protein n=1 Tax=Streptomyces venezuelae TaxID=54571 RepID=A0A5P2BTC3_STRVZ|nr:hypothetical protein DEJ48_10345 [Streptomyces venezuelae]
MRVLDQILAPLAKGLARFALPVDAVDVPAELPGGSCDRVPGTLQRLAGALDVLRSGLVDQVDHVVETVAFETH